MGCAQVEVGSMTATTNTVVRELVVSLFFIAVLSSSPNKVAASAGRPQIEEMFRPLPGTEGKVDDARCDVEAVELANSQQVKHSCMLFFISFFKLLFFFGESV